VVSGFFEVGCFSFFEADIFLALCINVIFRILKISISAILFYDCSNPYPQQHWTARKTAKGGITNPQPVIS